MTCGASAISTFTVGVSSDGPVPEIVMFLSLSDNPVPGSSDDGLSDGACASADGLADGGWSGCVTAGGLTSAGVTGGWSA